MEPTGAVRRNASHRAMRVSTLNTLTDFRTFCRHARSMAFACGHADGWHDRTVLAAEGLTALQIIDHRVGAGALARDGHEVVVNYSDWLYDGSAPKHRSSKIDSSLERGQPISFTLGEGR
jgi:hypothetical protein